VYCPSVTYIVECPDIGEVIEGTWRDSGTVNTMNNLGRVKRNAA
jgi:hypothetical protein